MGRVAGKTKETAGSLIGDDELAREDRLQQEAAQTREEAKEQAAGARQAEQEAELHHRAHEDCYIANSVHTEIRVVGARR